MAPRRVPSAVYVHYNLEYLGEEGTKFERGKEIPYSLSRERGGKWKKGELREESWSSSLESSIKGAESLDERDRKRDNRDVPETRSIIAFPLRIRISNWETIRERDHPVSRRETHSFRLLPSQLPRCVYTSFSSFFRARICT